VKNEVVIQIRLSREWRPTDKARAIERAFTIMWTNWNKAHMNDHTPRRSWSGVVISVIETSAMLKYRA